MLKKLKILTFTQKTIEVEIDDSKTVYELKRSLYMHPEISSPPEFQRIVSAGKILVNEDPLSHYNLDDGKPLVIMGLQQMEREMEARTAASDKVPVSTTEPPVIKKELPNNEKVEYIVKMGYQEGDVISALRANFDDVELAKEYLAKGISGTSEITVKPLTSAVATSEEALSKGVTSSDEVASVGASLAEVTSDSSTCDKIEVPMFDVLRKDPFFRLLCCAIRKNPKGLDFAISDFARRCPVVFNYMAIHCEEFIAMLFETSDDEDEKDDSAVF